MRVIDCLSAGHGRTVMHHSSPLTLASRCSGLRRIAGAARLLCAVQVLGAAGCHAAPDADPNEGVTAEHGDDDVCIESVAHDVSDVSCEERASAACPPPAYPDGAASGVILKVLQRCFLREVILQVEFERGCATRFGLSIDALPDSAECVAARLGAARYDCLADVSCGEGVVTTLR